MSYYFNQCGSCRHINPNDNSGYKYYCDYYRSYYPLEDRACSHYDYDKTRDYQELERKDNPSACYITTIMCEILGLPDDNIYLSKLREFRDNVLQKNPKYAKILLQYDIVGPIISTRLKNDENRVEISKDLVRRYIAPIVVMVVNNKNEEAVLSYMEMVNELKNKYCLVNYENKKVTNYNPSLGGHGYVKKKVR